MKRILCSLVAALVLTLAGAAVALSQEGSSQPAVDQQPTTPTTDQSSTMDQSSTTTSSDMPKTASPLPLMGLGGLSALASGLWLSRPRRKP